MSLLSIVDERGDTRRLSAEAFPLSLGGGSADLRVIDSQAAPVLGWLGLAEGRIFIQPAGGAALSINGTVLRTSSWLADGDILRLGPARIEVTLDGGEMHWRVHPASPVEDDDTEPPILLTPPSPGALTPTTTPTATPAAAHGSTAVRPIAFEPGVGLAKRRRGGRGRLLGLASVLVLTVLGAAAAFVFTARSVRVEIEPAPDTLELEGTLLAIEIGGRYLLRPGAYTVRAAKAGYRPLVAPFEVGAEAQQGIRFSLQPLPGRLVVEGPAGIEVAIAGEPVGTLPMEPVELEPGFHDIRLRGEGYRETTLEVEIEGLGRLQTLAVEPPAQSRSAAPSAVRQPAAVPPRREDGELAITSDPPGATVTVDGIYRGETPLELPLASGAHEVGISKAGFVPQSRRLEVRAGARAEGSFSLEAEEGKLEIAASPPDAELVVDGEPWGRAQGTHELTTVAHEIEIRRPGYVTYRGTVTPIAGVVQSIQVTLQTLEERESEASPPVLMTAEGHELRRIEPLRFTLGASRREPGRRSNEALREVELTRRYYLAAHEVSNAQFRRFRPGHASGTINVHSLDSDDRPVVRVTWPDAAAYCNWLSAREGLPPAYIETGDGTFEAVTPMSRGYRLPTEAEWARAARHASSQTGQGLDGLKFPWGPSLPVGEASGNFADLSAKDYLPGVLSDYDDGFPATAPVDHFPANALGVRQLGGNVAEWVHDVYSPRPPGVDGVVQDPFGPAEGEFRVIRGSSYLHSTVTELRLSFRDYGNEARPDVGFRIARYVE